LTHASPDVDDVDPITPAHLLCGRPVISLPHYNVQDDEICDPTYRETKTEVYKGEPRLRHCCFNTSGAGGERNLTALCEYHRTTRNNA